MSANFAKEDRNWLSSFISKDSLPEITKSVMIQTFDMESNFDAELIERELIETKFLKKVCLLKILLFVPEFFLTTLIFGKKQRTNLLTTTSLYYQFLTNKLKFREFQAQLSDFVKTGGEII